MEIFLPYCLQKGYSGKLISTNAPDPRLNELILKNRQRGKAEVIPRGDPKTGRKILECFKKGEILFIAIDQDTRVPSIWVPFFGIPAKTPSSAASLALKTGAPVLSYLALRQADGTFQVQIHNLGVFEKKYQDARKDTYWVTRALSLHIEKLIRDCPEQWAWFHRRWRNAPPPEEWEFVQQMEAELKTTQP